MQADVTDAAEHKREKGQAKMGCNISCSVEMARGGHTPDEITSADGKHS